MKLLNAIIAGIGAGVKCLWWPDYVKKGIIMSISKEMPWGTKIEMMPGKRQNYPNAKDYTAIYLGAVKDSNCIIVIRKGNKTPQQWHRNFWRQLTNI